MPEHVGPVVVSLPVADRRRSSAFYRAFLGQAPPGEPQDDGEPEPLEFLINDGLRLMLIPRGGFGWVVSGQEVADPGTVEVLLSRDLPSQAEVRAISDLAAASGGTVVVDPAAQPWGYTTIVADPDGHLWQVTAAEPERLTRPA